MHLAEFVLRDFINLEHWCERNTTILVDDVLPERIEMAERHRAFNAWCGDVYKFVLFLKEFRSDLSIEVFETFAGPYRIGLAVIKHLNPGDAPTKEELNALSQAIQEKHRRIESIDEIFEAMDPKPISSLQEVLLG